ncbi:MAG: sodium:solute symporter family protein [Rickettsiaceae bacterium]
MLIVFIALYMVFSIAIGLYSSIGVRNSTDYILAGRSIPLYMTITTVFATWFGSESVVGTPPVFINDGLRGIIAEPIGTGCCLIIVGIFYAARLYRMKLFTIGDFYRQRYSRLVELLVSLTICVSYLVWMSAQIVALGLVIKLVFNDAVSFEVTMFIGLAIVMIYTILGGMKFLVIMDFIQMISIVIGLLAVAFLIASRFEGGAIEIISTAAENDKFVFWPETNFHDTLEFVATFLTLALGSVPQQDVFQRVMAAKDERTAVLGSTIGGIVYIIFCFVPIFITYGIALLSPGIFEQTLEAGGDQQRILVDYIFKETPVFLQVLFFGALLSAIMSTASGTLLAPSALFAENILKESLKLTDRG